MVWGGDGGDEPVKEGVGAEDGEEVSAFEAGEHVRVEPIEWDGFHGGASREGEAADDCGGGNEEAAEDDRGE